MDSSTRVALVTGGAGAIGRAIAAGLCADGFGVTIADVDAARAMAVAGELEVGHVVLDVTDTAAVQSAVAQIGRVDVLVNGAGWDDLMAFVATDEEFWDRVIEINYKGVLRMTRALLPGMIERGYGRIVNVASDAGRVGSSLEAVYSGSKGAVIAFTKAVAREVARRGVTANVVSPGPTDTPFLARVAERSGADAGKVIQAIVAAVPMKRLATPEDVAAAARFFARDDADYITGQTLSVSGGLTMA